MTAGFGELKQVIDLRPVFHGKEESIRAHVILCWLALLLTISTFTGSAGTSRHAAELTKTQRNLPAKLTTAHPKKIIEASPATPVTSSDTTGK